MIIKEASGADVGIGHRSRSKGKALVVAELWMRKRKGEVGGCPSSQQHSQNQSKRIWKSSAKSEVKEGKLRSGDSALHDGDRRGVEQRDSR